MSSKLKKTIVIDGIKYTPNVDIFKIRNKWTLRSLLETDTATGELDLKTKLTQYVDIDNTIKYSSNLVTVVLPRNISISICKSRVEKYNTKLVSHPQAAGKYIILGEQYEFSPRQRFQPKQKVYSVTESQDTLEPYTEIDNALSFLSKYTFGVELETIGIPLQKSEANSLGFHELYDGSIIGPEYATGIMNYKNLHHLDYFLNLLKTVSAHDHTCSLHIHVGNVGYSSENLCAIYSLFQRLQEDLNLLIAPYKKDYRFLYNKQKDHCQNLPLLPKVSEDDIKKLFRLPTNTDLRDYLSRSAKWNLNGRYYTVNFLNYICKSFPNNTLELRALQMSFNYDYVITWLIINTAIIDYAVNNNKKVLDKREKIQIEDVLQYFVKDELILEKTLNNYYKIKNIIYNKKYLDGDTNTNSMSLDRELSTLLPVIPSIVDKNRECYNILSKINRDLLDIMNTEITSDHIELDKITIRSMSGGYTYPSKSDCKSILYNIAEYIEHNITNLDASKKYVIKELQASSNFYRSKDITHYVIIDDYKIYYKVSYTDTVHVVSMACNPYKKPIEPSSTISSNPFSIDSIMGYELARPTFTRLTSIPNVTSITINTEEE